MPGWDLDIVRNEVHQGVARVRDALLKYVIMVHASETRTIE
jgi:hypothetical protein